MPQLPDSARDPDAPLTQIEQAAIVVLSMGEESAAAVLRCLDREALLQLTQAMSRMSGIRVDSVKSTLARFFDDYRNQSGVHGASRGFLSRTLSLALGPQIAGTVLDSIYGDEIRPKMQRLQWASPRWLASRLESEHPRLQAVFLAFLPTKLAGEVLDHLPTDGREQVILDVARLSDVDRDLLAQIEELTDQYLSELDSQSASIEGVKQAAEMLNRVQGDKKALVARLRQQDPAVASEIERGMYDFFILANQSQATIQRLIEAVSPQQWAVALKGAEPAIVNALLGAMPRRQADMFQEEMDRVGPLPLSRVEAARREIMAEVKALADAGDVEIQLFAEAVVE